MFKKIYPLTLIAAVCVLIAGCGGFNDKADPVSDTRVYFDTAISITVYDERAQELLEGCFAICDDMEAVLSAHDENSELYRVNHIGKGTVTVSDTLADCIAMGLEAGDISGGEFDITILPVSALWDFRSGSGSVPRPEEISEALENVDQAAVSLDGDELTLGDDGTMIDLGAIAKGYISGRIKDYLRENGCGGAVINLGGNVSTLGSKGGKSFKVGIQKPFTERGETIALINMNEGCVISSGTYERYFTDSDEKLYHHILSAKTGYPCDTGLSQVTVIGNDDMLCDTLSTVFMLTGKEKAEAIVRDRGYDLKLVFVDNDGRAVLFDPGLGERDITEGEVIDLT